MMPSIDLQTVAELNHGVLHGENCAITGVCIDSRLINKGDLFVAIEGEHVNGNDYIADAINQGAAGVLTQTAVEVDASLVVVEDVLASLGKIAAQNRKLSHATVVGITGSMGKTTCKNIIANILAESHSVLATEGNFNNELGLPLTIGKLSEQHSHAVIEMGAAQLGDIEYLANIAKPDVAVVTNVAEAHLGRFGSIENIALTKGEIYQALSDSGVAIINQDDTYADFWCNRLQGQRVVKVSLHNASADVYAQSISTGVDGVECKVVALGEQFDISSQLLGEHNIANILIAIAICKVLSVDTADIIAAVKKVRPESGRLSLSLGLKDVAIIDDSYNANPGAMRAAIDVLASMPGKKIAVLGDMAELGEQADTLHQQVGRYAASKNIDQLYAVGRYAQKVCSGFGDKAKAYANKEQLCAELMQQVNEQTTLLVKGSRSAAMENVVAAFKGLDTNSNRVAQ